MNEDRAVSITISLTQDNYQYLQKNKWYSAEEISSLFNQILRIVKSFGSHKEKTV